MAGGLGAEIGGDVMLTQGETLSIAVGGAGQTGGPVYGRFGGGGSFVVGPNDTRVMIAGGGGAFHSYNGGPGLTGTAGGSANGASGGTDGSGGGSPGSGSS